MPQTKSFEDEITSLIFLIGRNMRQQNIESCDLHHTERLSFTQVEALKFIKKRKNPLMREVSDHLSIAAPSLTPLIDELEKRELIKRDPSEKDRRAILIMLTEKGEDFLKKILKIKTKKMHYIFSKLTKDEQKTLIGILEKLSA